MTGLERSTHLTILGRAAGAGRNCHLPPMHETEQLKIASFIRERIRKEQETSREARQPRPGGQTPRGQGRR